MKGDLYGICRMLDGTFTLRTIKPARGAKPIVVSADEIKQLDRKDALCGGGDFALVEVNAYQPFFTGGGELTGEERRLLVPAVTYSSRDMDKMYIVPLTCAAVKLPRLSYSMYEPGGGYINPTFLSQKPKKEGGEE